MALPGVLGEGSPERCQGAPERTPGAGEGSSWKVAPWLPELSPALFPGWPVEGGTAAGEGYTAPQARQCQLAAHGRRGAGDGAPQGRSQPQPLSSCGGKGKPGGGRACRSAARALAAGARAPLPAAATRDSPALCPEALLGRAASHSGARSRSPQDKRSDAKTPPGKVSACRKYFTREFSPSPGGAPRRAGGAEPWQRGRSRVREGERAGEGGSAAV